MMNIDIVSFQDKHIEQAGALLAARHRRDRLSMPELPVRFEDSAVASAAVAATWQQAGTTGVAALRAGRLAGYMLGRPLIDETWGRSAWVRPAGCALAPDEDAELARSLYAALAAPWVAQGIFSHFAVLPVADLAPINAWFGLSFGLEQVYALADLAQLDPKPAPAVPGLEIRRAGPEDRQLLADFSDIIWRHQVQAPVWGIMLPGSWPSSVQDGLSWPTMPTSLFGWPSSTGKRWAARATGRPSRATTTCSHLTAAAN
jgi:hypothetical protein